MTPEFLSRRSTSWPRIFKGQLTGRTFGHVREALQENLRTVRKQLLDEQNMLTVVVQYVRAARERYKDWADVRNKWAAVDNGLKLTYRRAREAYGDDDADPTVEKLHEWRKQVKYLRYQLEILRPLWPERMDELIREAETMGELLTRLRLRPTLACKCTTGVQNLTQTRKLSPDK